MQTMDAIYKEYAETVYRYLLSLTHNADLAEELTQETFYQAVKGINRFDGKCKISTWLCAIAKNQLSTYYHKHPPTEALTGNEKLLSDSAETRALQNLGAADLFKQIHALKEPAREVLYLRLFGDLSFREIGDIFGKTENWARVTYYRAKEQLKSEVL